MKYIIIPLFVGVITQCIKFIIETIKTKKINILRLFDGMGGCLVLIVVWCPLLVQLFI